jgi:diaminopimelate decarboxylase
MKAEGCGVDCSSLAELILSANCGFKGEEIMFTSNDTPPQEYIEAKRLGAIINLDDIRFFFKPKVIYYILMIHTTGVSFSHISCLEKWLDSLPGNRINKFLFCCCNLDTIVILDVVCLRFNPGSLCVGNSIIGNPLESKFGVTKEQLFDGYMLLKSKGVQRYRD